METKSRSQILLDEKIAKVDDMNFDKIYGLDEVVNNEIDNFSAIKEPKATIQQQPKKIEDDTVFSLEIQPNEFLDTMDWNAPQKEEQKKVVIKNKPLFFAFTSIAVLLCILFVYNVFVIKSLESNARNVSMSFELPVEESENDYISFDNGNKLEIQNSGNFSNHRNSDDFLQTNWFNSICNAITSMFGGHY